MKQPLIAKANESTIGSGNLIEEMHSESDRRVGQVFRTMLLFTVAMVLGPITTYFVTKSYVFEGKLNNTIQPVIVPIKKKLFQLFFSLLLSVQRRELHLLSGLGCVGDSCHSCGLHLHSMARR